MDKVKPLYGSVVISVISVGFEIDERTPRNAFPQVQLLIYRNLQWYSQNRETLEWWVSVHRVVNIRWFHENPGT
jgi:hypothetical protein